MLDTVDIVSRLAAATVFGAAIGLNRNLHHKSTGLRTMALVCLGSAIAVLAFADSRDAAAVSRVAQGLVTGIGFLGAGVIVRGEEKIHGLTTAASIWVTALVGIACGLGAWMILLTAAALIVALFALGRPIERRVHAWFDGRGQTDDPSDPPQ